jgi:error-prone DNA polymerase
MPRLLAENGLDVVHSRKIVCWHAGVAENYVPYIYMVYAELTCLSNFSFQRGASSAQELFTRAKALGYAALAITDEASLAGIVRAYEAAKAVDLKLIVGSEITLDVDSAQALKLVLLAANAEGYRALCELLTLARRAADKGEYWLERAQFAALANPGWRVLWVPNMTHSPLVWDAQSRFLRALFPTLGEPDSTRLPLYPLAGSALLNEDCRACLPWQTSQQESSNAALSASPRLWIAVQLHRQADDAQKLARLTALGSAQRIALVATGDVHMHVRARRALQDVITAIRARCTLSEAGHRLFANGERHLRTGAELAALYPAELLTESVRISDACQFDLKDLGYVYPHELVPKGVSATSHLRQLTLIGAQRRWPEGTPNPVQAQITHELELIQALAYEHFFLTVHDIVCFARSAGILCQGRGSAANSVVCFALGITEVDPDRHAVLFERFISRERNEPPDIDVDFEHERREEVLQYIYRKYGRERAALAATVVRYQPKSAIRDVGRALGLSLDQIAVINSSLAWWEDAEQLQSRLSEQGFDPHSPTFVRLKVLVDQLLDQPRHLSQHVGGFVISEHPLHTLVPVENASMPGRTIIQWDKDDLETLGLLKVDCLALGMLSCIRRCLDLVAESHGKSFSLASIPAEDPATYAMLQNADTVGVFQVESRAQMSMLPRLKPRCFYDLVVQVAIVRPGPIEGGMVHPYLRRRNDEEAISYPSDAVRGVLERTLGVPIFQEQVMQLAMVAAGFSAGEADELRRSMAAWKRRGGLEHFERRIFAGMAERGYSSEFAAQIFAQIKGFGSYGFPESHACSFALLVYASAWLKCHYPAAFTCALLNAYPLGFYSPDQLLQDAARHHIKAHAPDICHSKIDSYLRDGAIVLGLREVRGLSQTAATEIVNARLMAEFSDIASLCARVRLGKRDLAALADSGALRSLTGHRHAARWAVEGVQAATPLWGVDAPEPDVELSVPSAAADMLQDYAGLGYSVEHHPLAFMRKDLARMGIHSVAQITAARHESCHRAAGLITLRQRPGRANGTMFLTLEDESGWLNVIIWPRIVERFRVFLLGHSMLEIAGRFEHVQGVRHLIAQSIRPMPTCTNAPTLPKQRAVGYRG